MNNSKRRRAQRDEVKLDWACACKGCRCMAEARGMGQRCHACARGQHRRAERFLPLAKSKTLVWRYRNPTKREVVSALEVARRARGEKKHWWQRVKKR